ncbi:uncharacterized protein [Primulina huaijiensis]|uniref:uncharacterized protein n=1 Tax=Primulina huaijiensis TaxID=1492673 RepID=UPI003CC77B6D
MYSILLYFSPKSFSGKRSCSYSPFTSLSTLCCAAQDAYSSSDDNVVLDLSYTEQQQRTQKHATTGSIINDLNTLNFTRHGKPTVSDYNWIFYRYFKSGSVVLDELSEVYVGMKRFGPTPNLLTYNTLLNGLIFVGSLKDAILIVEDMINCGFLPSFTVISKLLRRLLKVGNVVDSVIVFEIMLNVNYTPSYYNVSTLIWGLCKAGMVQKAYFFFLAILEKEYFPCGCLFDHILWALCKSEQSYLALAFFGWLKKKGIACTVRSYTALVYGFSKERLWIEAFNCLNEMENDNYKPHLITYTIVIKSLCDDGKVDKALKYVGKMEKVGCVPDLVTYNIVLRELCHQGRVVEVGELIRLIDQKGFFPDLFTYSALAGGMLKSDKVEIANRLLVDTVSRSSSIDDVVYNIYLHSTRCHGNSRETLLLMESMMEKGFKPTSVSYNTILKGLCKENKVDEALELLDSANWPTNGPDLISFNTILSAACKQGNSSMIRRILYRMEFEGIKLDVVSSTCLIQYFCTTGQISESLKLLESMVSDGPPPNTVTLNTLLIGLCKNRLLGMAEKIFNYVKGIGIPPNTVTYNILMRASVREDNDLLLYELSRDMHRQNLKPDASTYGCFIYSLCRGGKISLALQLRDQLLENGISANIFIYNAILEAMFKKGMFWQIIILFKDMAMDGCEPNEGSFGILKRASRNGWMRNYPRALKIVELVMSGNLDNMNGRVGKIT